MLCFDALLGSMNQVALFADVPSSRRSDAPSSRHSRPPRPPRQAPRTYFLRIEGCGAQSALIAAILELGKIGKVLDSGCGTTADPSCGWIELEARQPDVPGLRSALPPELNARAVEVLDAQPGQGKIYAKQVPLYRR